VGRFLADLPWCWLAASLVGAVAVTVLRRQAVDLSSIAVVCSVILSGVAAAFVSAWLRHGDAFTAALELDRRCNLHERVSSTVASIKASSGDAAATTSLIADTEQALAKVDVATVFSLSMSRRWWRPLVPAIAALAGAFWLVPNAPTTRVAAAAPTSQSIKQATARLERKMSEKERRAEELKFIEAQRLLEKLKDETQRLQTESSLDRKEVLLRLNDLAKQLEERRRAVAIASELKHDLRQVQSKASRPEESLNQSLRRGDFHRAAEHLKQIREQLRSGVLDDQRQQELRQQLNEMQQQLAAAVERQRQRQAAAEMQLASGLNKTAANDADAPSPAETSKLRDRAASAAAESERLKQLQRSIADAADGMERRRDSDTQRALEGLQKQLDQLASENDEQQLLEQGLQDITDAKMEIGRADDPSSQTARTEGEPSPESNGRESGAGQGDEPGLGGLKPGVGTKQNETPTSEEASRTTDARVRAQLGAGPLSVVGSSDGANAKGRALQVIREQAEARTGDTQPQPVGRQTLDRSQRAQKREYFDALRNKE
jgi:hypothetical protein